MLAQVLAALTVLLIPGAASAPCPLGTVLFNVSTTADVQGLTSAINCTGEGLFNVNWYSNLSVGQTIDVRDKKHVTVMGYGFPVIRAALDSNTDSSTAIDPGRSAGIFSVSNGSTLTLHQLVVDGVQVTGKGAATVILSSSLFAFDCAFRNNGASIGGAVYALQSEIHLRGSTRFTNNTAGRTGGAVHASDNSSVHIDGDINFVDNLAGSYGGAIHVSSGSAVHVKGYLRLVNNVANGFGGAVFAESAQVNITGTTSFINNSAGYDGGAIFTTTDSTEATIFVDGHSSFVGNFAGGIGGAIRTISSDLHIKGMASFIRNYAESSGGAIYASPNSSINIGGNTSFANNKAGNSGGAILADASEVKITGNTYFANNSADSSGGAVNAYQSKIHVDGNAQFVHNSAVQSGGAIVASESEIHIKGNTHFTANSAVSYGGAIEQTNCNLTVGDDSAFKGNSAGFGGGIYADGEGSLSLMGRVVFTENVAEANGGAISIAAPMALIMAGLTFSSNEADLGGALYLSSQRDTERFYKECTFRHNSATDGGALYLYADTGSDIFVASSFIGNYARKSGGAIYLLGTLEMSDTTFVRNEAGTDGMAIATVTAASMVELSNVSFTGNTVHCPLGEYGYDKLDGNISRFETVCDGCLTDANTAQADVELVDETGIPSCTELPTGTTGRSSGTTVMSLHLKPGYYRTSKGSIDILECYRQEACVGGQNDDQYCAAGYTGAYCAVCAPGFAPGIAYSCRKCSDVAKISAVGFALLAVVLVLWGAAMLLWRLGRVVDEAIDEETDELRVATTRRCGRFQDALIKVLPLAAIKIIVVVWQIVTQVSAIAVDSYPKEYEMFLSYLTFANFDIGIVMFYSCIYSPDFYGRLLFATIAPLLVILLLATSYYISKRRHRISTHRLQGVLSKHLSAALFVAFFVYSSVSYTIFQTFVCDKLDDGVSYLRADYSLTCTTELHRTYAAYASCMVVVYPLGIPAIFGWWLVRNRKDLQMPNRQEMIHLQAFTGIWSTYKPSQCYYEVVECCRRIALTASAVFLTPNSVGQIALVLFLAVVFLFISESSSPFERNVDMKLYRWGNSIVLASMYVALLMKIDITHENARMLSVLGGVLITANVGMILTVLVQSIVLAKEWRGFGATTNEILPPVRRPALLRWHGMRSGHSLRILDAHEEESKTDTSAHWSTTAGSKKEPLSPVVPALVRRQHPWRRFPEQGEQNTST